MNKNYVSGLDEFIDSHGMWDALCTIIESLPHGSGIDGTWFVDAPQNKRNVYFTNSYHCMTDNGYYDGWLDFRIIIPYSDLFRLVKSIRDIQDGCAAHDEKELAIAMSKYQAHTFTLTFSWANARVAKKYAEFLRYDLESDFAYYFRETLPEVIQNL